MYHTEQNGSSALSVLIISRNTLIREGLKALIADMPFRIVFERDTIESATSQPAGNAALVLVGVALAPERFELFKALRSAYPHARIVCYTPGVNLPLRILSGMFGSLLDGCLLSSSPPHALRQSLDLIMMGESVLPFSMIASAVPDEVPVTDGEVPVGDTTFSSRELQVLEILQSGKSNKSIARELGLSEATVKVHIKNVLRKLGASNRTEAAIWMTKNKKMLVEGEHGQAPLEAGDEASLHAMANEDF